MLVKTGRGAGSCRVAAKRTPTVTKLDLATCNIRLHKNVSGVPVRPHVGMLQRISGRKAKVDTRGVPPAVGPSSETVQTPKAKTNNGCPDSTFSRTRWKRENAYCTVRYGMVEVEPFVRGIVCVEAALCGTA